MLKIVWIPALDPPLLKLEGRIAGPWVEELEGVWNSFKWTASHPVIDLTEVTFITPEGRALLGRMVRHRAEVRVTLLMQPTVDRIKRESRENPDCLDDPSPGAKGANEES